MVKRLFRWLAALPLLAAMMLVQALANTPVASMPYAIDYNGWLTVKVSVNGEGPYDFIIDTGATQSLIFQNLADIHSYEPTNGPPQTVLGLAAEGAFPTHNIGDLDIGGAPLRNLVTVILPDWSVEQRPQGVIGLDFLARYIVLFDAVEGRLELYAPAAPPPRERTRRWRRTNLDADNFGLDIGELYTLKGRVNNRSVRFLVDLGASGTLINRPALAAVSGNGIMIRIRPTGGDTSSRITDALEASQNVQSVIVQRIRVGGVYWYRHPLAIHNSPIFEELDVHTEPFGLFGADLIRDRSFLLDFPNGEIRIGPRVRS